MKKKLLLCIYFLMFILRLTYGRGIEGEFGVRADGLGGAFTAVADDMEALFYNPAGMSFAKNSMFSFGYGRYMGEIYRAFLGGIYLSSGYTIAACMNYSYLKLPETDGFGIQLSSYIVGDYLNGYVGISRNIINSLSSGITLKYIRKRIGYVSKNYLVGDIGLMFHHFINIGASFQNFSEVLFNRELINEYPLPICRLGISKKFEWVNFLISGEYVYEYNNTSFFTLGMELAPFSAIMVRSGIMFEKRDVTYSFGGSISLNYGDNSLFINYSLILSSISLDYLMSLSLPL